MVLAYRLDLSGEIAIQFLDSILDQRQPTGRDFNECTMNKLPDAPLGKPARMNRATLPRPGAQYQENH